MLSMTDIFPGPSPDLGCRPKQIKFTRSKIERDVRVKLEGAGKRA